MSMQAPQAAHPVIDRLRAMLPAGSVSTAPDELRLCAMDVYGEGTLPLAIVRPDTVEILQHAVRIAHDHGVPMVPRGGGPRPIPRPREAP